MPLILSVCSPPDVLTRAPNAARNDRIEPATALLHLLAALLLRKSCRICSNAVHPTNHLLLCSPE
jgi:hypothetical protein